MNPILWQKSLDKLSISRSELHIWRVDLGEINHGLQNIILQLSSEELRCSEDFIFERDRHRYQITHSMKRLILASYLKCEPKCLEFEMGIQGKPALTSLQNSLNLQFNISHSHDLILIAITVEDSVGIDIEYYNKKLSIEGLDEIIFSPEEKIIFSTLKSEQEKEEAIFRCWTRKEAFLKAHGIGLVIDIANITVDMNKFTEGNMKVFTHHAQIQTIACKFFNLNVDDFYAVVAVIGTFEKKLFYYDAVSIC